MNFVATIASVGIMPNAHMQAWFNMGWGECPLTTLKHRISSRVFAIISMLPFLLLASLEFSITNTTFYIFFYQGRPLTRNPVSATEMTLNMVC